MGNRNRCILVFLGLTLLTFSTSSAQNDTVSSPATLLEKPKFSPFKPTMAVIVGVLTAVFSVTFLVLLYAKHCKRSTGGGGGANVYRSDHYYYSSSSAGRKNSGIDRTVVESLPVFRFGALGAQVEGLECAVCLSRYDRSEVLRLLPKCSHAFHVECVDTWLDAHSTCPLCRLRVDPEDVLLAFRPPRADVETGRVSGGGDGGGSGYRRVSGRHSSAGERAFQIADAAALRRSVDSWRQSRRNKRDSARKDGLLLSQSSNNNKLDHRIVVSQRSGPHRHDQRWSDVQPSDLLYLQSEMIMSDSRRFSSSGYRPTTRHHQQLHLFRYAKRQQNGTANGIDDGGGGRKVINSRSVSEIAGMSRFSNDNNRARNDTNYQGQDQDQHQHTGLLSN